MKNYKANIRMGGRVVEVNIQAKNFLDAKSMLEAQYGKGSIFSGPSETR